MNSYDLILEKYNTLSKQQKKIADYFITNINDVLFYSVSDLAKRIDVGSTSIIRFAQFLGFDGFQELRSDFYKYQQTFLSLDEKIKHSLEVIDSNGFSYKNITNKEIDYLTKSINEIDQKIIESSLSYILNSKCLHIFGSGPDLPLAYHLAFSLNRFGLKTNFVTECGRDLIEKMLTIDKNDCGIVFSFNRPSNDFKTIMNILHDNNINIILITDIKLPPMIRLATVVLCSERGPLGSLHSPIVPMAIANVLIMGVAEKLKEKSVKYLEYLMDLRKKYLPEYK